MPVELVPARAVGPAEDEANLIAACVRGDREAERTLFRRAYPRVNATVTRLLGSSRDVDDVVQETFIAAFRSLPRFRGEAKLATWLDRIAVRAVFAYLAARKRRPVPLEIVPELEDRAASPRDRAYARDGLRRLYDALARLKPEARTAFALHAIDGRTIAEVAELMETSVIAAKLRIWRARRALERRAARDPVLAELVGDPARRCP